MGADASPLEGIVLGILVAVILFWAPLFIYLCST